MLRAQQLIPALPLMPQSHHSNKLHTVQQGQQGFCKAQCEVLSLLRLYRRAGGAAAAAANACLSAAHLRFRKVRRLSERLHKSKSAHDEIQPRLSFGPPLTGQPCIWRGSLERFKLHQAHGRPVAVLA